MVQINLFRKSFVLNNNAWNYITAQTNDYYLIEKITFKLYKCVLNISILDRNTWNHTTVYKSFVLDRNTWKYITVCKQMIIDKCNGTLKIVMITTKNLQIDKTLALNNSLGVNVIKLNWKSVVDFYF